ncbi:hypothetical protein BC941DRAFT_359054, partial [Chlamydoabsidia padenii]
LSSYDIRQLYQVPISSLSLSFPPMLIKTFWSCPMNSQARTVWYRFLVNKIPLQIIKNRMK